MKKWILFAALGVALAGYYFIATKMPAERSATQSTALASDADVKGGYEVLKNQSARPGFNAVEAAHQMVKQCEFSHTEIKHHQADNLMQLSEGIDVYLQDGNDWQTLIPFFHKHSLNFDLLDNAYIKFSASKSSVTYLSESVEAFLARLKGVYIGTESFSSLILNQTERSQINQRFKVPEELNTLRIGVQVSLYSLLLFC